MGLVATSPQKGEGIIESAFWPTISVAHFRKEARIYSAITDESAYALLSRALVRVADDLDHYAEAMERKGYKTLKEVPAPRFGALTRQEILFYEALYSYAKKLISEQYHDVDLTRKAGSDKSEALSSQAPKWHAQYLEAIRAFLGKPRNYVRAV